MNRASLYTGAVLAGLAVAAVGKPANGQTATDLGNVDVNGANAASSSQAVGPVVPTTASQFAPSRPSLNQEQPQSTTSSDAM